MIRGPLRLVFRVLAICYSVVVVPAIVWAWVTDVSMRNIHTEHIAPDLLLSILTLPLSLFTAWASPLLLDTSLVFTALLTACAGIQAAILWRISTAPKSSSEVADKITRHNA
jgi:hypothetical protein